MAGKRVRLAAMLLCAAFLLGCQLTQTLLPLRGSGTIPPSGAPLIPEQITTASVAAAQATSTPQLVLAAKTLHEEQLTPKATFDARWPILEWGGDTRVNNFNQAAEAFVQNEIKSFKQNLTELPNDPIFQENGSSLHIDFTPTSNSNGILAELFEVSFYSAGAAHPGHYSHSINYDLRSGKILELSDLFQPDSAYLQALSTDCIEDLEARKRLEWHEGAQPKPENYQVWNITPDGLLITFDEYQVASYAAGAQTVLIPYAKLKALLRPGGPLDGYFAP